MASDRVVRTVCLITALLCASTPALACGGGPVTPVRAQSPADAVRKALVPGLTRVGVAPELAKSQTSLLTAEDLAVLGANPKMMRAGGMEDDTAFWLAMGGIALITLLMVGIFI